MSTKLGYAVTLDWFESIKLRNSHSHFVWGIRHVNTALPDEIILEGSSVFLVFSDAHVMCSCASGSCFLMRSSSIVLFCRPCPWGSRMLYLV